MQQEETSEKRISPELEALARQIAKRSAANPHKQVSKPKPGFARNPLLTLPRNNKCPCLSGKKFKKCCLNKLPRVIPESLAKNFEEQMSKPDLVFVTADNKELVVDKEAELINAGENI